MSLIEKRYKQEYKLDHFCTLFSIAILRAEQLEENVRLLEMDRKEIEGEAREFQRYLGEIQDYLYKCINTLEPKKDMQGDNLLSLKDVLEIVPISKSTWWAGTSDGRFPKPIKIGRRSLWLESEVLQSIEKFKEKS